MFNLGANSKCLLYCSIKTNVVLSLNTNCVRNPYVEHLKPETMRVTLSLGSVVLYP